MSMRERRILSAMTAEAREKRERLEAEGKDPLTGRPECEGGGDASESGRSRRRGGAGVSEGGGEGGTEA